MVGHYILLQTEFRNVVEVFEPVELRISKKEMFTLIWRSS